MNVTQGNRPNLVDKNVRFRTTYYFRVFDYCWQGDVPVQGNRTYRQIVPETDTLYRYRMTGKASALGNRIKFEAGTLDASDIDPFGTDVVYNADVGGYVRRTKEDATDIARHAADERAAVAARSAALDRYATLSRMLLDSIDKKQPAEITDPLRDAVKNALAAYSAAQGPAPSGPDHALLTALDAKIDALGAAVKAGQPATDAQHAAAAATVNGAAMQAAAAVLQSVKDALAAAQKPADAHMLTDQCTTGGLRQRGFQIMGPEGMQEFDQNKRLILAMFSSAKPLTATLQEYAARVTQPKMRPADQLLPLVREDVRALAAQRALDKLEVRAASDAKPTVDDILADTLAAFSAEGDK